MAVFPVNDTLDCTYLNTDARVIGSTEKHLSTPLRSKPSFNLYLNTLRQGKGLRLLFHCLSANNCSKASMLHSVWIHGPNLWHTHCRFRALPEPALDSQINLAWNKYSSTLNIVVTLCFQISITAIVNSATEITYLVSVGNILKSLDYPSWAGNPWSTLSGYLAHGRLTGIRVWYGTVSQARFIHGYVYCRWIAIDDYPNRGYITGNRIWQDVLKFNFPANLTCFNEK